MYDRGKKDPFRAYSIYRATSLHAVHTCIGEVSSRLHCDSHEHGTEEAFLAVDLSPIE